MMKMQASLVELSWPLIAACCRRCVFLWCISSLVGVFVGYSVKEVNIVKSIIHHTQDNDVPLSPPSSFTHAQYVQHMTEHTCIITEHSKKHRQLQPELCELQCNPFLIATEATEADLWKLQLCSLKYIYVLFII